MKDRSMPAGPDAPLVRSRYPPRRLAIRRLLITLFWLGALGAGAVLWAGTAVRAHRTVFSVDLPLVEFLAAHRTAFLTWTARFISDVASPVGLLVTLAVLVGLARWPGTSWRRRGWQPVLAAAATLGGIDVVESTIKAWVARPRPAPGLAVSNVSAHGFAFPSGHTSQSTAVYGLIAVLLWQRYRGRTQRIETVMLGLAAILAVGMSRLYLGVHWFSDVLFGWVLGASWLAVVLAAWTAIRIHRGDEDRPD